MTTSRTQAVVSVPAMVRTWASSERRMTVFSESESLDERMEWKMVGISASSRSLIVALALMFSIWARLSCECVRDVWLSITWKDYSFLADE